MKISRFAVVSSILLSLLLSVSAVAQIAPSTITAGSNTNGYGPWAYRESSNANVFYKMLCFENGAMAGPDTCIFRDAPGHYSLYNGAGTTQLGAPTFTEGTYQGTTSVPITTTSFTALAAAAADIAVPAGTVGKAGKRLRIHADGVYTTGAASLLNAEVMLCTVSGCASGTVVAPAGCAITSTNQANVLANGQFSLDCTLTSTATVGAAGTFMAKGNFGVQLGTATTAAISPFLDTAVAASAAVDETVQEFVNVAFKFSTSNAGNAAVLHSYSVEVMN